MAQKFETEDVAMGFCVNFIGVRWQAQRYELVTISQGSIRGSDVWTDARGRPLDISPGYVDRIAPLTRDEALDLFRNTLARVDDREEAERCLAGVARQIGDAAFVLMHVYEP